MLSMPTLDEFWEAVAAGDLETVRQGLPELADLRHPSGASSIQWAMYTGQPDVAEALVSAGATVDLATACTIGAIDSIPSDADPNALSADGFRPLALAAAFGHNDIVRLLISKGADPNLRSTALGGVPPLQSAVFGKNLEAVALLIEAGADVNGRQGGGFTALMGAGQNGDAPMVRFLLEHGADPALADGEGKRAVDYAASDEITELIQTA